MIEISKGDRIVVAGAGPLGLGTWKVGLMGKVEDFVDKEVCWICLDDIPGQIWLGHVSDLVKIDAD